MPELDNVTLKNVSLTQENEVHFINFVNIIYTLYIDHENTKIQRL